MEVLQIVALVLPPAIGVLMIVLHLKIQNAIAGLRGELIDKLTVVSDKVLLHQADRDATERWIEWVSQEIRQLQDQQNALAQSLTRCQAFHQGEGRELSK